MLVASLTTGRTISGSGGGTAPGSSAMSIWSVIGWIESSYRFFN